MAYLTACPAEWQSPGGAEKKLLADTRNHEGADFSPELAAKGNLSGRSLGRPASLIAPPCR
jgi:hypothetical protein